MLLIVLMFLLPDKIWELLDRHKYIFALVFLSMLFVGYLWEMRKRKRQNENISKSVVEFLWYILYLWLVLIVCIIVIYLYDILLLPGQAGFLV